MPFTIKVKTTKGAFYSNGLDLIVSVSWPNGTVNPTTIEANRPTLSKKTKKKKDTVTNLLLCYRNVNTELLLFSNWLWTPNVYSDCGQNFKTLVPRGIYSYPIHAEILTFVWMNCSN